MVDDMQKKKVQKDKFESFMLETDIIYFKFYDNQLIEEKDIVQTMDANRELSEIGEVKRIIHGGKHTMITSTARELLERIGLPALCEAYVIESPAQKILFRFFVKLRKPKHPTKAFDSVEDALDWFKTFPN